MSKLPLALSAVIAAACGAHQPAASPDSHIYVFESDESGFNTKTVFYDDGREVVAFDTQFTPALAQQALDFVATRTAHPVTYAVITHPNPDKFNGLTVFQAHGATVIASTEVAAAMPGVHAYKKAFFVGANMFTADTYPQLGTPDLTFDGAYTLHLAGGGTVELRDLPHAGVSSKQTVAWIPAARALVVGDLVHDHAHAWLEGGIVAGKPTPDLRGWLSDLDELAARYPASATVYGGRGDVVPLADAVRDQRAYLVRAEAIVDRYLAHTDKRELSGAAASAHYQHLEAELEAEFPTYRFGYLIRYGIYGLVTSKL